MTALRTVGDYGHWAGRHRFRLLNSTDPHRLIASYSGHALRRTVGQLPGCGPVEHCPRDPNLQYPGAPSLPRSVRARTTVGPGTGDSLPG